MTSDPLADVFPDTQDAPLPRVLTRGPGDFDGMEPAPEDTRWAPQRRDGERR